MKKILSFIFSLCCYGSFAQTIVWDIVAMETLIANHKVQHASFSKMKQEEAEISSLQKSIADKMTQIEYFQSKFYNSLKSVEAIKKTGKDIIYAGDIVQDIVKYQNQMRDYATKDPALALVAVKTQSQLVERTNSLLEYIYNVAIIETDVNLMDNKQRLNLLNHVIKELRTMRGLAYAVSRQMRTAMRNGVLKTLMPGQFKYNNDRSKLVKQILDDYKPKISK
jgi:formyltetrahydrofolate synthetase